MTRGEYVKASSIFPGSLNAPDIPIVYISITPPPFEEIATVQKTAIIDTGSSVTVISEQIRDELNIIPDDSWPCVTYHEYGKREYPVCTLQIILPGSILKILRVVIMPIKADVVIGRDVLNLLRICIKTSINY